MSEDGSRQVTSDKTTTRPSSSTCLRPSVYACMRTCTRMSTCYCLDDAPLTSSGSVTTQEPGRCTSPRRQDRSRYIRVYMWMYIAHTRFSSKHRPSINRRPDGGTLIQGQSPAWWPHPTSSVLCACGKFGPVPAWQLALAAARALAILG